MNKAQYTEWTKFRESKKSTITQKEFELVCQLHADLFNHQFYKPCTCRPKEINQWISDINKVYNSLAVSQDNDNS